MVQLERFKLDDASEYLKIAKDKSTEKFFRLAYCENIEEAQELMELYVNSFNYEAFKVVDERGNIVGAILGEKKTNKVLDVCYFISSKMRRRGYCQEAIGQFAKYVSENTEYKELQFCIRHNNKASKTFMEKKMKIKPAYSTKMFIHYKQDILKF